QNFPKTLVAGQETSFEMTINNPSGEPEQIEIVASSSLEELNIEIPSVLVQANSSETLTVTLSVPENMQFDKSEEEDGKELSGYVRIKFTNEKETLPDGVRIYPRPELEFNPSSMTIRGDAGETVIKEFNLENKSPFTLYDITLTLEITSVSKNPQEQIEQSLTLVEGNVISTLEGKGIGNNEANNRLKFEIPITAKTEEITGNIIAEAEMFPQPIIMPLTLEIQDEAEFELTITPETKSVTVDYIETSGTYEKITKNLRVKNTGEMTLKNIQVLVKNDKVCTPGWLKFLDETRINSLGEGQTQNILMELSAPLGHDGTTMQCKIRYYYDNPLEPESRVDGELDGSNWIQITPRSS
ncbi:MAG: hypothetical protein JW772_04050, partial [Candidatus Diapherotrites archaeon]|nr:hypothetical protein [Candidatus Diapherotrites archaeon]